MRWRRCPSAQQPQTALHKWRKRKAFEAQVTASLEAVDGQVQDEPPSTVDVTALSPQDGGAAGGAEDPTSEAAAMLGSVLGGAGEAVLLGQDTAWPEAINSQIESGD